MRVSSRRLPDRQYAEVDLESKIITIDLAKNTNPARCYLHEKLHLRHPKLSEKKIRQMETLISLK